MKEKTADEMFEELGYIKKYENYLEIKYVYEDKLLGDNFNFILTFTKKSKLIFHNGENGRCIGIGIKFLQAINKKCQELGWLDE